MPQYAPNMPLPTLKQSGKTLLDVALMTTAALTPPVLSYAFDFSGNGSHDVTCYSHSNVNVSYEHVGLYLTTVIVADTAGHQYKDTAIVNVLDRSEMDSIFKAIWNNVKTALDSNDIPTALSYFASGTRDVYSYNYNLLQTHLGEVALDMSDINIVRVKDRIAEYEMRKIEDGVEHAYYIEFVQDVDGVWRLSFY